MRLRGGEGCGHPPLWMTGDARMRGEHAESGIREGWTQEIARLCTIMHDWTRFGSARGTGGTDLGITTIGGNEPLSPAFAKATAGRLALSPLRGARELAYRLLVVARCAGTGAHSTFLGGFFLVSSPNLRGGAGLRLGLGLRGQPIKVKFNRGTVASGKRRAGGRAQSGHFLPFFCISTQKIFFFSFIDLYPPLLGWSGAEGHAGGAHGRMGATVRHFGARHPARRRTECRPGRF